MSITAKTSIQGGSSVLRLLIVAVLRMTWPFGAFYLSQIAQPLFVAALVALAVGSRLFLNNFSHLWGDFAAAAILSDLPITVVLLIAQYYLALRLSDGATKGQNPIVSNV